MSYCDKCQVYLKLSDSFKEWMATNFPDFELNADSNNHYRHGFRYVDVGEATEPKESSDKKSRWLKEDEYGNYCIWVRVNPKARGKHVHIDKFVYNQEGTCDHHAVFLCECKPAEVQKRVDEAREIMAKLGFEESI